MKNDRLKREADELLRGYRLLEMLEDYGEVHVIGSYRMGLMTWRDVDVYVENQGVRMTDIYGLMARIFDVLEPKWFEGKEVVEEEHHHYFVGFETEITGERWNVDIWFFHGGIIREAIEYCDRIVRAVREEPRLGDEIMGIKQALMETGEYGIGFTSVDVYRAVIENGVNGIEEFYAQMGC